MSQNRPKKLVTELETIRLAGDLFGRRAGAWSASIGDLLDTPRALKFALNAVSRVWARVNGEVDIDELIILTALRYRAGSVYSFLVRRALDLRLLGRTTALSSDDDKEERERQLEDLRAEWKEALAGTDANRLAVEVLVGDVFPSAYLITGRKLWIHSNRLQSVASDRGEIYMERITAGDLTHGAIRDQSVLRLLDALSRGKKTEEFAHAFTTTRAYAELATFFDDELRRRGNNIRISSPIRLQAASTMLAVESQDARRELLYQRPTHHLVKHWIFNANMDQEYIEWAKTEVLNRIPSDLLHAMEIYFDLFRDAHIATELQIPVRDAVIAKARELFDRMSAEEFATCFPAHFPYTLSHLVRLDTRMGLEQLRTRVDDWQWLKPHLLAGLRARPDILVPHVLPLFGKYGPQPGPFEIYKFDDEAVANFFGDDRAEFYTLIMQRFTPSADIDDNFKRLFPLAAKEAGLILSGAGK